MTFLALLLIIAVLVTAYTFFWWRFGEWFGYEAYWRWEGFLWIGACLVYMTPVFALTALG